MISEFFGSHLVGCSGAIGFLGHGRPAEARNFSNGMIGSKFTADKYYGRSSLKEFEAAKSVQKWAACGDGADGIDVDCPGADGDYIQAAIGSDCHGIA
jgi:hypothetical protein